MGSESKNGGQFQAGTKKMIQSLKEVVNCPDAEIYAVLKECNMDPNDAVQRLLSLDTFHEVKSKRERRKEMKETHDSKPRVHSSGLNRGVRSTSENNAGWCGSSQTSYNELGKTAYNGQNGYAAPSHHSSVPHVTGRTTNQQPSSHSDSYSTSIASGDAISTSVQPSRGNQSSWVNNSSGHLSMADIVKMGTNPSKGSHVSSETSSLQQDAVETNYHVGSSQNSGEIAGQNAFRDEWPVIEQSTAASGSSAVNPNAEMHAHMSNSYNNESNVPKNYQSDVSDCNASAFASSRQKVFEASSQRPYHADDLPFNSHRGTYDTEEGPNLSYSKISTSDKVVVAVSSATINMQQLSLEKDEHEDHCTVVLPNNLQELAADCSHLSFGTYKSGNSSASRQASFENDLGINAAGIDVSFSNHLDTRISGYNHEELLGSLYNHGRGTLDSKYYDLPRSSQPELINHDVLEALGHKEISSLPNFSSENIQRANSGMPFAREDPKFRNMPPLQSDMAYSDSVRGSDLSLSQLLGTPSVPSRYSSTVSSVNSPAISMSEAPRPGALPLSHASSVIPQQLTARSYSQPMYDQLANIIGYPSEPQSFSRMPSTLQQPYGGDTGLHQSVPGMDYSFPQYRSGASISRVQPSAAAVGVHGSFGTSALNHGNFLHNSSVPPINSRDYDDGLRNFDDGLRNYDDVLRSQYLSGNNLTPLHQSSRTLSSISDSPYNNLLGHNQQYAGYRPEQVGELPSQFQHYGSMGYPDYYNSQMGITQERQRQSLNDLPSGGVPDLSAQQLHQIWQRTY